MNQYRLGNDHLQASIKLHGAELCQLRTAAGMELLWDGDPAVWGRQAPTLFPVVGRLRQDRLRPGGQDYPMTRHGFARDQDWTLVSLSGHACTFRLQDNDSTRAQYPFGFRLSVTFRLEGPALRVQYDLHNPGEAPLWASLGVHPAFRWPLLPQLPKRAHWLEFEREEAERLAILDDAGLLGGQTQPSPLEGRRLKLREDLFDADALLFLPVRSHSLRYGAAAPSGAPTLELSWEGFPELGIWSKPGADFLCLEPWRGFASPAEFQGEFRDKPGVFQVGPGATVTAAYTVRVANA